MLRNRPMHKISPGLSQAIAYIAKSGCPTRGLQPGGLYVKRIGDKYRTPVLHQPCIQLRFLSQNTNSRDIDDSDSGNSMAAKWIKHFNNTVAAHAEISLWSFLALRVGSWYTLSAMYAFIPDIGPELAVGYLIAKFTGKLRQPANFALAAVISHQFPILGTIKASALIGLIKKKPDPNEAEKPMIIKKVEQFLDWIQGPLDKYGFSYFIASKVNIGLLIIGASYAVKTGLDVRFYGYLFRSF